MCSVYRFVMVGVARVALGVQVLARRSRFGSGASFCCRLSVCGSILYIYGAFLCDTYTASMSSWAFSDGYLSNCK